MHFDPQKKIWRIKQFDVLNNKLNASDKRTTNKSQIIIMFFFEISLCIQVETFYWKNTG